jgi:hypothetical protein
MMLPALPAMPRKLMDRESMGSSRPSRTGGEGQQRGKERVGRLLPWRRSWSRQ